MERAEGPGKKKAPSQPERRRSAERADLLAEALQMAEEVYWRWDLSTGQTVLSPRWREMLGLPKDGPVDHWRDRVHPEDLPLVAAELEAVREGAAAEIVIRCRLRHHDGTDRWAKVRTAAHRGDDDAVDALVGTITDITEQHHTQDVFERLVRHNALILNAAGDGIYCIDVHGKAVFVNPAAARMLGSSVAELTGVPLCRFRPGCKGSAGFIEHEEGCPIDDTLRTGLAHRVYDGEFVRTDGRRLPVEYVASPIREQGRLNGAVIVFEDVTERRWSEEEIRRERRFSDGLIKSSIDGILAFDTDLCVTLWNPTMERMSGISAEVILDAPLDTALPFAEETGELRHARAVLKGESLIVTDRPYRFGTGRTVRTGFFEGRYAPLYDDAGEILGGVAIIRDTTEEKRRDEEILGSREKLARSEKLAALGTLVSGVGHELRTPMSYINNHLYLMKMLADRIKAEDPTMAPVADEFLRRTESSMKGITRMSNLLDDLRATYRTDDADVKEVDLKDLVEEALRLFRGAYEGPVRLMADVRPTGKMRVEAGRIQQVVINLINNAAEAMTGGGEIRIRVGPTEGGAQILVEDDGVGIPADVQAEMFHPFYTTKKKGSGLGLYLVKQIVERHMGTITCASAPGEGTTFRIFFPRREAPEEEKKVGKEASTPKAV